MTPCPSHPATCPTESTSGSTSAACLPPPPRCKPFERSSKASPTPSQAPSAPPPNSPGSTPRSSTSSAEAPSTNYCANAPPTSAACPCSPAPSKQPRSATSSYKHATTDGSAQISRTYAKSSPTHSNLRDTNRERTNQLALVTHHKERESVDETGYSNSGVPNPPTGCPIRHERGGLRPYRLLFRRWRRFWPGVHSLALQLPTPLRTRADDH